MSVMTMPRAAEDVSAVETGDEPGRWRASSGVRRTLRALLASVLGTLPLCSIFTDIGWLVDVWLAMAIVILPALVLRFWFAPSALHVWPGVALLVPWLTFRFVHSHAFWGFIPLTASWHRVGAMLTNLHKTVSNDVAPVHSTPAIKLTLCVLLGLLAVLVDLVAVVGRHGALAGVPLLVVYTVSGAVPRQPVSWWLFAGAAAGFLLLLSLDAGDDLDQWGHHVAKSRSTRASSVIAVSAQRIGVIAIAIAVVLPLAVPSDARNVIANIFHNGHNGHQGRGSGFAASGGGGGIDPFVALAGALRRPSKQNLFKVTINGPINANSTTSVVQPGYLRVNVLPDYTGKGWQAGSHGAQQNLDDTDFGAGQAPQSQDATFTATITINGALRSNPPVFANPQHVSNLPQSATWASDDQLLLGTTVTGSTQYQEQVVQPEPSVSLLRSATQPAPDMQPWLQLPTLPNYVTQLVKRLTKKATTPYDRALALDQYFTNSKNGFIYSLTTKTGDSGSELVDFLKNRAGFCQQYAAALAVMLRAAGVPSRVVLGYTHAVPNEGTFTVSTDDAHAWVEANFNGVGWIPFDPTPLAGITGGTANDFPWAKHGAQGNVDPGAPSFHSSSIPNGLGHRESSTAATSATSAGATHGPWWPMPLLITVLCLLVLGSIPFLVRRSRHLRRLARVRRGDTDALWAELSDTATDLGYVWSSARSPRQVAGWLNGPAGAAASPALHTLTAVVEQQRYGRASQPADGAALSKQLTTVTGGLRAGRPSRARLRALLWPASLGWTRFGQHGGTRRH
jgi:hypothetical protein